jgi:hypothetical protein
MTTTHVRRLAFALAFGVLPLAACGGDDDVEVQEAPLPTPATEQAGDALRVSDVELGRSVDASNRISDDGGTDDFRPNDTIYASVATDGGAGGTLVARWSFEDGQVVDETTRSHQAGPQITEFHISKPDGLPTGSYKLEILLDGRVVETEEFEVGN